MILHWFVGPQVDLADANDLRRCCRGRDHRWDADNDILSWCFFFCEFCDVWKCIVNSMKFDDIWYLPYEFSLVIRCGWFVNFGFVIVTSEFITVYLGIFANGIFCISLFFALKNLIPGVLLNVIACEEFFRMRLVIRQWKNYIFTGYYLQAASTVISENLILTVSKNIFRICGCKSILQLSENQTIQRMRELIHCGTISSLIFLEWII